MRENSSACWLLLSSKCARTAGFRKVTRIPKTALFKKSLTWRRHQVGSWCQSPGHCQGGGSGPESPRTWGASVASLLRLNIEQNTTQHIYIMSNTWVPPELLSVDAISGAGPPWCQLHCSRDFADKNWFHFHPPQDSFSHTTMQRILFASPLLWWQPSSAVWKQKEREERFPPFPPLLGSWLRQTVLFPAFLSSTDQTSPQNCFNLSQSVCFGQIQNKINTIYRFSD